MAIRNPSRWPSRARWLASGAVTAVVAVNAVGLLGIGLARRAVREQAERVLGLETATAARSLESLLFATRADLAFLCSSAALAPIGDDRGAAEAALLLFLRGHPEVAHLLVRSPAGHALLEAGRRGGIPVLWRPTGDSSDISRGRRITASFAVPGGADRPTLEAEIDVAPLLPRYGGPTRRLALFDARGAVLARESGVDLGGLRGEAVVAAPGWSAPAPWHLQSFEGKGALDVLVEPLARRYRLGVALNLSAMGLAVILGALAIQELRIRERLEAEGQQQKRVRALERQLFHAERLSTVGRLAAGMAHEINNPLEGIANYLALCRSALARGDAAASARHLDGVQAGLDRAAAVVRQALAHADPAAAPMAPCDLNALTEEAVRFVAARPERGAIAFRQELCETAPVVRGSAVMLGQVLLNLILNACEAQPEGGTVIARTAIRDGHAVVEIADRGPGIKAEDATRIFEPFYSTKRSTGLGLSVCQAIVKRHSGTLMVSDHQGGGALFSLALPLEGHEG